jgi:uroporphyrinogen-III synthase
MSDSLTGKKILITRPQHQSETLCRMIENKGGQVIRFPVIGIRAVPDTDTLRQTLNRVADYDIGIFISQNAVSWTLELLNKEINALYNLKLIALGKATARLLKEAGFTDISHTETVASSEALLELPVLQANVLKGSRVIIFRGTGGRELLAERLCERGAEVDYAEVYQRIPIEYDNEIIDGIWLHDLPDYVVISSNEGLINLFDMLSSKYRSILLDTQLVVLGPRMAELAERLGFRKAPVIAEETSDEGLFRAIMQVAGVVNK